MKFEKKERDKLFKMENKLKLKLADKLKGKAQLLSCPTQELINSQLESIDPIALQAMNKNKDQKLRLAEIRNNQLKVKKELEGLGICSKIIKIKQMPTINKGLKAAEYYLKKHNKNFNSGLNQNNDTN